MKIILQGQQKETIQRNPNLLINWDFRNLVNQSGKTEWVNSQTALFDKWSFSAGNVANSVSIVDGAVKLQSVDSYANLQNQILDYEYFAGKTVTASVLFTGEPGSVSIPIRYSQDYVGTNLINTESGLQLLSNTVTIPDEIDRIIQIIQCRPGFEVYIYAVKLEFGNQQTLARKNAAGEWEIIDPPNYDLQYTLCSLYSPITGEWVGNQHSNPNLLVNWDFRNPVNRNGKTEYTTNGYSIDKWMGKCSVMDGFLRIDGYINQVLTDTPLSVPLTFSAMLNDGSLVYGTKSLSDLTSQIYFYVGSQIQLVREKSGGGFLLWTESTVDVIACKLELGSQQTLARKNSSGEWEIIDPQNYDLQYALCSLYNPITGKRAEDVSNNENLLDNWYFPNLINHRGKNEYTSTGNAIDRWSIYDTPGLVVNNGYITLKTGTYWRQSLETKLIGALYGKTVTGSMLFADGTLASGTVTLPNSQPTNSAQNYGFWDNSPGTNSYIRIFPEGSSPVALFAGNVSKDVNVVAVKLEIGKRQTLAHQENGKWVINEIPNYQQELAKCQRYQISLLDKTITGQSYLAKVKATSTNYAYGVLSLPVTMVKKPTIITDCTSSNPYNAFGIYSTGYSSGEGKIVSITTYSKMENGVILMCQGSNFVQGNDYQIWIPDTNTHQFLLDANF